MIPSKRFIILLLLAAPFFIAGSMIGAFTALGILYISILLLLALVDILFYPRQSSILMRRVIPERLSLSMPSSVAIEVENVGLRSAVIDIAERLPPDMEVVEKAHPIRVNRLTRAMLKYKLTAHKRGKYPLSEVMFVCIQVPG